MVEHMLNTEEARTLNGIVGAGTHQPGDTVQMLVIVDNGGLVDGWLFGVRAQAYVVGTHADEGWPRDTEPEDHPATAAGGITTASMPRPGQNVTAQAGTAEVAMDAPDAGC